jgi:hypothetical protein
VHGVLFLMFMAVLYRAGSARGWPRRRWLIAFVSSVVPFGTFMFDRSLRRELADVTPSPERAAAVGPIVRATPVTEDDARGPGNVFDET